MPAARRNAIVAGARSRRPLGTSLSPATLTFNPVGFNASSVTSTPTWGSLSPPPPGCSWGTRVGTALSLRGILGRLGFHWPNKNPCAGTAPTGNIWCMEGTGSSCTRTGGSPQLDTAVCQFIWIKNQSPVSHRGLGNTRCKRTECFLSRQLSDFPRDLSLLCSGVARILAEQSR